MSGAGPAQQPAGLSAVFFPALCLLQVLSLPCHLPQLQHIRLNELPEGHYALFCPKREGAQGHQNDKDLEAAPAVVWHYHVNGRPLPPVCGAQPGLAGGLLPTRPPSQPLCAQRVTGQTGQHFPEKLPALSSELPSSSGVFVRCSSNQLQPFRDGRSNILRA